MTKPQANWTAFKTILSSRHVKLALTLELADLDDGAIFEVVHVPPNKRESSVPGSDSQVTPLMLGAALPPQPPPSGVKREKKDFLPTSSNHHPVDPSHIDPASVQRTTHHLGATTDTLKLGAPITSAAAALADPINDVLQDVPIQGPGFDTTPITVKFRMKTWWVRKFSNNSIISCNKSLRTPLKMKLLTELMVTEGKIPF